MKNNSNYIKRGIISAIICTVSVGFTSFLEYYVSDENSIGVGLVSLLLMYPYISYRLGHFAVFSRKETIYQSVLVGALYALLLTSVYNITAMPYVIFYGGSYLVGSYVNKYFKLRQE